MGSQQRLERGVYLASCADMLDEAEYIVEYLKPFEKGGFTRQVVGCLPNLHKNHFAPKSLFQTTHKLFSRDLQIYTS